MREGKDYANGPIAPLLWRRGALVMRRVCSVAWHRTGYHEEHHTQSHDDAQGAMMGPHGMMGMPGMMGL